MLAKLNILRLFYILLLCFSSGLLSGQDLQFSQYYSAPLQLNPALTGGFGAKYRVSAIYRDQWRAPLDKSIASFGAALDLRFDSSNAQGIFKMTAAKPA